MNTINPAEAAKLTPAQRARMALRVYANSADKTGTVMCSQHRDHYYLHHPGACGHGEYGATCEFC